jgi:DNA gyrase subunit A
LQARTGKGRALVNLLNLSEEEKVQDCIAVREFDDEHFLLMATQQGIVKKTVLSAYSRPLKGGIIAIKLDEGDQLIDVVKVAAGQDVVLSTATGMSIRFSEGDARPMGRNTMGVKGISLSAGDEVVGMVIADEATTLLSICENGYGKRTPFGQGELDAAEEEVGEVEPAAPDEEGGAAAASSGNMRYRRQKRGGKGLRDIKTTERNGPVIGTLAVQDGDDVLMVTKAGKIQRIRAADISVIGRNTQGVRVMRFDEEDKLASIALIPAAVVVDGEEEAAPPAVE